MSGRGHGGKGIGKGAAKLAEEKLVDAVSCPICMVQYNDGKHTPRNLGCSHAFCEWCIRSLGEKHIMQKVECPKCRHETLIDNADVTKLPCNFQLLEATDAIREHAAAHGDPACEICDDKHAATHRCMQCEEFMRTAASSMHGKMKATRTHLVQTTSELQTQGPMKPAAPPGALQMCAEHPDEPLKLWCDTCSRPICRDCIVVDHPRPEHEYNFLPAMFEKHRPELEATLDEVRQRIEPAEQAVEALQGVEAALAARCDVVCTEVDEHMDALVSAMLRRKGELSAACRQLAAEKGKRLALQREGLQGSIKGMQAAAAFAHSAIMRGEAAPMQTLCARAQLLGDLARMREQPLVLTPQETSSLTFVQDEADGITGGTCAAHGGVTGVATMPSMPSSCTADGEGLRSAKAGELPPWQRRPSSNTVPAPQSSGTGPSTRPPTRRRSEAARCTALGRGWSLMP